VSALSSRILEISRHREDFAATTPNGNPFKNKAPPTTGVTAGTAPKDSRAYGCRGSFHLIAVCGSTAPLFRWHRRSSLTHEIIFLMPPPARRVLHRYIESRSRLKAGQSTRSDDRVVDANCEAGLSGRVAQSRSTPFTRICSGPQKTKQICGLQSVINWRFTDFSPLGTRTAPRTGTLSEIGPPSLCQPQRPSFSGPRPGASWSATVERIVPSIPEPFLDNVARQITQRILRVMASFFRLTSIREPRWRAPPM
jgi:hypothetical protein